MRTPLFAVLALVLGAGLIRPTQAPAQQLEFWQPPPRAASCRGGAARLSFTTTIQGWKPGNSAVAFIAAMGSNLSAATSSRGFDTRRYAEQVIGAARAGAFTRLDFEGPGGPSPVFATSLVLISSAYAVSLFDQRGAWTPEERRLVLDWLARLDKNQNAKRRNASPDSIAAIAAARMALGAASGNKKLFNAGLKDFKKTGRLVKKAPYFEENPRDNNEDIAMMVLAAEAAMRSGVNAYAMKFRGYTLHDLVRAHAERSIALGPTPITETDTGSTGSYFSPNGYAAHVAWIPIYLSRFANTPTGAVVRRLHAAVQRTKPGRYDGTSLGGPTGCLWGL